MVGQPVNRMTILATANPGIRKRFLKEVFRFWSDVGFRNPGNQIKPAFQSRISMATWMVADLKSLVIERPSARDHDRPHVLIHARLGQDICCPIVLNICRRIGRGVCRDRIFWRGDHGLGRCWLRVGNIKSVFAQLERVGGK